MDKQTQLKEEVKNVPMQIGELNLEIQGLTPIISHRFSDKTIKEIEDKQQGVNIKTRQRREPEKEFDECIYWVDKKKGKVGFPSIAFKIAAIEVAKGKNYIEGLDGKKIKSAIQVVGELVEIKSDKPVMRTDTVKIGRGLTTIRYRAELKDWNCVLPIRFNYDLISVEQIVKVFDMAGFCIGVGDWRPQCNGIFGTFQVKR